MRLVRLRRWNRDREPGVRQPAAGQHRLAGLHLADELGGVSGGQRSHVAAVHGGHRRHVAGAEALELAHLHVLEALRLRLLGDRLVDLLRVAHVAGHARADVHVAAAARLGAQHVVEGRHAREVGGRHLHHGRHLAERLGRAPAVHPLRRAERRQGRRVAVGVERHQPLDLASQLVRHVDLGGIRDRCRGCLEVDRLVPSRREGRLAQSALVADLLHRSAITGPPRRGSGRASRRRR